MRVTTLLNKLLNLQGLRVAGLYFEDGAMIVKPETVIKWHRKGWRYYWRRKSQRGSSHRAPQRAIAAAR